MIELGNLFAAPKETPPVSISLFGKLEAIVGGYFLSEVTCGVFRGLWNSLYFDPSGQWERDGVKTIPENLIGYVDRKERWAFILERYREKFLGDTLEYSLSCIGVPSLDEEVFFVPVPIIYQRSFPPSFGSAMIFSAMKGCPLIFTCSTSLRKADHT
ncbi:hypothetical protein [Angelakisella massiliensis]|uniref:hypothetical protein n=1 Tax=Angelakisella massiliensis TaxID=1871018 RepID=UPI0023A8EBF1|nr:hypothetical protein [Angelakisella massiliensis]